MAEVLVSLFGALGTIVASYYAYAAHKQGKRSNSTIDEINDAVNHRKPGQPRLFDMVWSNFNRVSNLEHCVNEIQRDVKDLSHVVSQHETEIDIIEDKIEGTK